MQNANVDKQDNVTMDVNVHINVHIYETRIMKLVDNVYIHQDIHTFGMICNPYNVRRNTRHNHSNSHTLSSETKHSDVVI